MPDRETVIANIREDIDLLTHDRQPTTEELRIINDLSSAVVLLKEQECKDKMFHALEDDWKLLKELLKEQETTSTMESRLFHCEKCGYGIDDIYLSNEHDFDIYPHYCPNCGKVVKLE